jgi:hypothetical protein
MNSDSEARGRASWDGRRVVRLARLAVGVTLAVVGVLVVPDWVGALVPAWVWPRVRIGFLVALRAGYGAVAVGAPLGALVFAGLLLRTRRALWGRGLLLCLSLTLSLMALEGGALAWERWARRVPALPSRFAPALPALPGAFPERAGGAIELAVIGESSAAGEPYQDWLSVGRIVGWQLERVFPGRAVRVNVLAESGTRLERMHQRLAGLERRPDALIVYAGHNEFQARYLWSRGVPYYADEVPKRPAPAWAERVSPLDRMIGEALEAQRQSIRPPEVITRQLVDRPTCSEAEYAEILDDFGKRLEAIAAYCESIGCLPVLVIPPGNEAGFEPNRSVASRDTGPSRRAALARRMREARALEACDPARAEADYRDLLSSQPTFAEAHFRLARLRERAGDRAGACDHYARARDGDALPLRCPGPFQEAYRRVAARHPSLLVDGPAVLRAADPDGVAGDRLFNDAQHPALPGHVALSQAILNGLAGRRAFGWPDGRPAPVVDPAECARHFGVDDRAWAKVCERAADYYGKTAYIRFDPAERLAKAERYREAARRIAEGVAPAAAGVPGIGLPPPGERRADP